MYSIKKQFVSFHKTAYYNLSLLDFTSTDKKRVYIYRSGVLNNIWQSWNGFWRTVWLAHILGGIDAKNIIIPSYPNMDEASAIYLMLHFLGKRSVPNGRIRGSYQEPRWGRIDVIQDLSQRMASPGTKILNAFSVLGDAPKHLQIVRNAAIHLNKDNIREVRSILGYYRITDIEYPTDVILATDLRTGKIAIKNWIDELIAFLELVVV